MIPVTRLTELVNVVTYVVDHIEPTLQKDQLGRSKCLSDLSECMSHIDQYFEATANVSSLRQQKRELKVVYNTLRGLHTGLLDKSFGSAYLKTVLGDTQHKLYDLKSWATTKISSAPELLTSEEALKVCFDGNLKEGLQLLKEARAREALSSSEEAEEQRTKDSEKSEHEVYARILQSYGNRYRRKAPTKVNNFTVFQAPLLPIFEDFALMRPSVLKELHIKHTRIGPYFTIYENQYVLAVSKKTALEAVKSPPKTKKAQSARLARIQSYTDYLLALINDRSTVHYVKVSDVPAFTEATSDVMYFWIAAENQVRAMRKAAIVRGLRILQWNFPWNFSFDSEELKVLKKRMAEQSKESTQIGRDDKQLRKEIRKKHRDKE